MDNKILKRSKTLLVLLFLFLMVTLVQAEENIAVFPFGNKVEQDYNLTELAENEMTSLLVNQKRFDVIERKELNKILEEQHLSNSGIVDINQALQIGKIKGIRYGVFGQITNVSYTNKDLALVTLQLKIVDMETANIVFSKVYNARPKDEKNDNKETVLTNVLKEKFKKEISNDLINTFTIEGSIIDIRGKRVIIDAGKKQGVVKGMEFNVIDIQEKTSSRTQEKIKIETPVALLEVEQVISDNSSICKFKEGEKIKEGMTVKLVQIDDRYYKAEDIEKILARRGIQKGDLLVSIYGGAGAQMGANFPFETVQKDIKTSASFVNYGLQALFFIKSWLGIGIEFSMSDGTTNECSENGPNDKYYKEYKVDMTNIIFSGRINLNNKSFRAYIPFGLGNTNSKHSATVREHDPEYYEYYEYKEEKKESLFFGYLGLGVESNLTNNISLGLESRFNLIDTRGRFATGVLKLTYKFEELIKF